MMSKIFIDWAVKKYPDRTDLFECFKLFYTIAAGKGNTPEGCRQAEEEIMRRGV